MKLTFIPVLLLLHVALGKTEDVSVKDVNSVANIRNNNNGCECIVYNCGCCQHIQWDQLALNGSLCANASYLDHDYGISVTVTYNTFTIINETVSARNPPPICFGEDIVDLMQAEICIRLYDIQITKEKYHLCFALLGRIGKVKVATLPLGCIDEKLIMTVGKDIKTALHIENETQNNKIDVQPNVVLV